MTDIADKLAEGFDIAVAGATGEVGREMLKILDSRNFPVREVHLLASGRLSGRTIEFQGQKHPVVPAAEFDFGQVQLVLMAMNGTVAKELAPGAAECGCLVVDNSSAFRMDEDVPLVVAEVNPHVLEARPPKGIVANPNCSTMQLLVALNPIHARAGIRQLFVASYQSVSGAGNKGIEELRSQSVALLNGEKPEPKVFTDIIGFNTIPHIDSFQKNGFTREEMKMVWETHKILADPDIHISATAVRVPVFYGHGEVVFMTTKEYLGAAEVHQLLENAPGVTVVNECKDAGYPTPVTHAAGKDDVFVGRIREDIWERCGLHMWIVADNIRKGAALNAVQLLELLAAKHLV